jgi:hypothetical protein
MWYSIRWFLSLMVVFKYIAMHFVVIFLSNPSAYMRARESKIARARQRGRERARGLMESKNYWCNRSKKYEFRKRGGGPRCFCSKNVLPPTKMKNILNPALEKHSRIWWDDYRSSNAMKDINNSHLVGTQGRRTGRYTYSAAPSYV